MSGQPLKNPMDASKFRREYMNQLALRADLDDFNLQANKVFKRTGQKNELQDYRTPAEKLRDLEGIKRIVRGKLQTIMSSSTASEVIEQIDSGDLVFLSQNIDAMLDTLKKMYSVGITDAEQFLSFYSKYMKKRLMTGGIELGLQQSTGDNIMLSLETIKDNAVTVEQLKEIYSAIERSRAFSARDNSEIRNSLEDIKLYIDLVGTQARDILKNQDKYDPNAIAALQELVNNLSQNMPTKDQIGIIMRRISAMDNSNIADKREISAQLEKLRELIEQDDSFKIELQQLEELVRELAGKEPVPKREPKKKEPIVSTEGIELIPKDKIEKSTGKDLNRQIEQIYQQLEFKYGDPTQAKRVFKQLFGISKNEYKNANVARKIQTLSDNYDLVVTEFRIGKVGGAGLKKKIIRGTGLVRAYTPKPAEIDTTTGIEPTAKYTQFGRFLIHKNKLSDDIVSIRRPSGTFVVDFPSQRVSKNLGKVFRSIIGGGSPTFDDLNSLNEEERVYLHKLSKSAQIQDKLNIPAPKKDDDDKDIHRYELLKGQIMSGQDNKEMVKEFKILILKLSKKGLLPKGQVKDILIDLATMGF